MDDSVAPYDKINFRFIIIFIILYSNHFLSICLNHDIVVAHWNVQVFLAHSSNGSCPNGWFETNLAIVLVHEIKQINLLVLTLD